MIEFLTASQNMQFTVALMVMFGIAILEGVLTIIGLGFSNMIESMLPDVELDTSIGGIEDIEAPSALSRVLSWIRVGEVPVLMLLVILLTSFGLIGIAIQSFMTNTFGFLLPGIVASVVAFVISLPVLRVFGGLLNRVMPQDESEAVTSESLVGRMAVITIGTARKNSPAEAKVRDQHGTAHYVMVEPDLDEEFKQGDEVLLVNKAGRIFKVIQTSNTSLSS